MSTTTIDSHTQAASHEMSVGSFLSTYVFSRDHKVIGIQFLFSTLIWFIVGGLLALGIRWQLAWPWSNMPVIGNMLFSAEGGQISPEFYTVLVTMHATVMIFLVIIPILAGAFGNFLIPLMIGADDMAFPTLNMLSYWFMWPAFIFFGAAFFTDGYGAAAGWTSYPPLSAMTTAAPGSGNAQTYWLLGVTFVGVSSMLGSVNYMTTIIQMRAPGMTMFRLPLTIWGMFITALLQAFALPVLTAAGFMLLADRLFGTGFFLPEALSVNNSPMVSGGGQPLLWQHLFWFYSHPAVYIMILPAMGMVSDILACFARKPIFGYKPMVYSICGIAGLGFIVWGHHMFVSGMNPGLGMTFMVATMMIALPSAVKTFNWLGTIYGGKVRFATPMLFALSFVSMFVIGGLSGIFMAATPVDIVIHDTYFIVAHFHYVLFAGTAMAVFGSIYFWFPKMFGRMMNETLGKIHFALTFLFMNGTFFTMHILGAGGFPRRLADPYHYPTFSHMLSMNQFMTICAIGMVAVQVIFAVNFFYSLFWGPKAGRNPWHANGLEWQAPSPPGHGNFDFQPIVYRGPYEYGSPESDEDFYPQTMPPKQERAELA
ncbi:cbb3-type cytochrome c oxidase subunit I [Blastopirellula sp. JC732]|uniref:Cbb3-type cytochrome c oxidase subunit I n=1 Tax=Blastopirellula sediminis TaxID=2894196 RepID=A0A9X1SIJ5_9BACT|nr:cbb3-type cytochrome c oxidase subunit I [Blastopirellula sediminis]MCC9605353.1 cbb3-type cytochrome c oxidase subunit I [Blastopirellula sediminis]MCC9631347.1 cbb3-type cytochrome c oxidase subunit I [Blastopirellula sediminis]